MRLPRILAISTLVILAPTVPASAASWFMGIGDLPGGAFSSAAFDVSADGRVVVGLGRSEVFFSSPTEAFRWTTETGMQSIGDLPGGGRDSRGYAVSADGSVVVGVSSSSSGNQAFRWSEGTGMVGLGDLPGGSSYSQSRAVSADGSVVGGSSSTDRTTEAFIWTEAHGMVGIGHLPGGGGGSSFVHDFSADGTIAVGGSAGAAGFEAFLWTEASGMIGLGDLPGGGVFLSTALAISADGAVVVGQGESALGLEAFRWTASEGMRGLGGLGGEPFRSDALDVSSDGSVIVGTSRSAAPFEAFIWSERRGMRRLQDVLEGYGLDLTGWTLDAARGVSDDGTVIAGSGTNPSGDREAWVARLAIAVDIDIKPGSCPNSWNRSSNGVLPVAVLGTEEFPVSEIDLSSVVITRADGLGGSTTPNEGPPGPHSVFEDVGTPLDGQLCDCHDFGGDSLLDLSMKFKTQQVVEALELDTLPPGDLVELVISGTLVDGTSFEGSDCVRLVPPGTPPGLLDVQSNAPGAWIEVAPLDEQLDGGGFAPFERTYPQSTEVALAASPMHNGRTLLGWRLEGGPLIEDTAIPLAILGTEQSIEAVYSQPPRPCGLGAELALLLPAVMWLWRRRSLH